jgi:small subunit ribosomal protein S6
MSKYETTVVLDGSLPQDAIERESKKIQDLLSANGKIIKIDEWGKRSLAYSINKKTTGFYLLFVYEYDGNAGKFIDNNFKFNENIIRHLTVVHEDTSIFAPQKTENEKISEVVSEIVVDEEEEE